MHNRRFAVFETRDMSAFEFTHPNGKRYRIVLGWGSSVCRDANLFGDSFSAQAFIEELPPEAQSAIGRQFMDPFRVEPRHINPSLHAPTFGGRQDLRQPYLNPAAKLCQAIAKSQLVVQLDESLVPVEDNRPELRMKIRMQLNTMLADERREAAVHRAALAQENPLTQALIYTGAFFHGLGNAAWDTLKWAKEVSDLGNPLLHMQHLVKSGYDAYREDDAVTVFARNLQAAQWREVVEALGFDPSQITNEMMAQAMEVVNLVWDDRTLRQDLTTFAWDYVKAQHPVELADMGGGAALEVVVTAVLAALTVGAGLAIAAAAKARHLPKLRKLGQLLLEFAEQAKKLARYTHEKARRNSRTNGSKPEVETPAVEHVNPPPKAKAESPAAKPLRHVDMPDDLLEDPQGVYGYMPTTDSQFHSSKWPVDWSNHSQVASARKTRLEYHAGLDKKREWVDTMRSEGVSDDDIARQIVDMRNQDRLSHYKTPEALESVYQRNTAKYGNKFGPSYESQVAKYGSSEEVINAALRSNDTMDILTGIATPK